MQYKALSRKEEDLARIIVNAAYVVHKNLGPVVLEHVYKICFCHELSKANVIAKRQVLLPIIYDGIEFDVSLRLDILVEDLIVCELKSVEYMPPVYDAQLLTYLKLSQKRIGFLINFNVPIIKNGIKRMIL
jgi:GxxExxY protein